MKINKYPWDSVTVHYAFRGLPKLDGPTTNFGFGLSADYCLFDFSLFRGCNLQNISRVEISPDSAFFVTCFQRGEDLWQATFAHVVYCEDGPHQIHSAGKGRERNEAIRRCVKAWHDAVKHYKLKISFGAIPPLFTGS